MISFSLLDKLIDKFNLYFSFLNKKQSISNSQNVNQVQGNSNRVNSPNMFIQHTQTIPEIAVSLPGNGAEQTFEGDITNHSGQLLVLEYVDINNIKTEFNREFRKLIFVRDNEILFPTNMFTSEIKEISMVVRYRTINGEIYEHKQIGTQTHRADGKYNISFNNTQIIKIK